MSTAVNVLEVVAEAEETDPLELPPLHDSIDPDALDRCIESGSVTVQFSYCGYTVTVTGEEQASISIVKNEDTIGLENALR